MIALSFAVALAMPPAHIAAARIASVAYGIEPELLLAIAEHETHWNAALVNGRACGPMQVIARNEAHCEAMCSPLIGYLEGARVLRAWLDATGELREALRGYGCGWATVDGAPVPHAPASCRGFDSWVIAHAEAIKRRVQS